MPDGEGYLMKVYLSLKKPLIVKTRKQVSFLETLDNGKEYLLKNGYDGLIYDFKGLPKEYIALKPEQIKSATGNRGTFDAGERNINYMPTDSKAPKRQPANRITRQAPAMPGNRFMLPAVSAGAKSAERFR